MAYSNNVITAPVSIYDVQRALNASANDVGTLCINGNVNEWAKNKPILLATIGQVSDAQKLIKVNIGTGQFKAYGHVITAVQGINGTAISSFYRNTNNWVYERPTGGYQSPYRLHDFAFYHHKAFPPSVTTFNKDDVETVNIRTTRPAFNIDLNGYYDDGTGDETQEDYLRTLGVRVSDLNIDPFESLNNNNPISAGKLAVWVVGGHLTDLTQWEGGGVVGNSPYFAELSDGVVTIPTSVFRNSSLTNFTLVGGIVFGAYSSYCIGFPIRSNCYPAKKISITDQFSIVSELIAWYQYGKGVWHEYDPDDPYGDYSAWWADGAFEDDVAWPVSGVATFYLGMRIQNQSGATITLSSEAGKIYIVDENAGNVRLNNGIVSSAKGGSGETITIADNQSVNVYTQLMDIPTLSAGAKKTYAIYYGLNYKIGTFTLQGATKVG